MISRLSPLALVACFPLLVTITPAAAQEGWIFAGPEAGRFQAFAGSCPLDDPATGNFLCFGLSCEAPNATPAWALMAGGTGLPDRFGMQVTVDGTGFAPLSMAPVPVEGIAKWRAEGQGAAEFLKMRAAIKTGARAELRFQGGLADTATLGLQGSSRALDQLWLHCADVVDTATMDPSAEIRAEIEAACAAKGGRTTFYGLFEQNEDLNGDGRPDALFDFAEAECSVPLPEFCSPMVGCVNALYLSQPEGGYALAFRDSVFGISELAPPLIAFESEAAGCGIFTGGRCTRRFRVDGGRMVPID